MAHELNRKVEGVGNMQTITPTCSCGWEGYAVAAYDDDQYFRIQRQEQVHLRDVVVAYVEQMRT